METIEWGFIRSAEVDDERMSNQLICHKISDVIQANPEMAERLKYFDTEMLLKLLNCLEMDFIERFSQPHQNVVKKFFRMV